MQFIGQCDRRLQMLVDRSVHAVMRRFGAPKSLITLVARLAIIATLCVFVGAVKRFASERGITIDAELKSYTAWFATVSSLFIVILYFVDRVDDDSAYVLSRLDSLFVRSSSHSLFKACALLNLVILLSVDVALSWALFTDIGIYPYLIAVIVGFAGYLLKTPKMPPPLQEKSSLRTAAPQSA